MSSALLLIGVAFVVHVLYWRGLYVGLHRASKQTVPKDSEKSEPISVVVAARNEARHLPTLLEALHRQTYSNFEVVLIDDGSTDETSALVSDWAQKDNRFHLLSISASGKKAALTQGIAQAKHDLLAFTDADAEPTSDWLTRLAAHHATTPEAVLIGYGPLRPAPSLLNRFARYETFLTACLTAGAVGLKHPYMAVGRNLSYRRSTFERVGGFEAHAHLKSGDDDLFVQAVAQTEAGTVQYLMDPATFVYSDAPQTWRNWFRQKRRHTSAGQAYAWAPKLHLAFFHGTNLLLWLAPLLLGVWGLAAIIGKWLVQGVVLHRAATLFHMRDLMPSFILWDGLYLLYNTLLAPLGVLFPPGRW